MFWCLQPKLVEVHTLHQSVVTESVTAHNEWEMPHTEWEKPPSDFQIPANEREIRVFLVGKYLPVSRKYCTSVSCWEIPPSEWEIPYECLLLWNTSQWVGNTCQWVGTRSICCWLCESMFVSAGNNSLSGMFVSAGNNSWSGDCTES